MGGSLINEYLLYFRILFIEFMIINLWRWSHKSAFVRIDLFLNILKYRKPDHTAVTIHKIATTNPKTPAAALLCLNI